MSTPPQQTYLARTFDDGRYDWARSRRVRRRAVVAEVVLIAVLVAATLAGSTTASGWPRWVFVLLSAGLLAFVPLHSVLNLGIRGLYDRDGRSLDEHQQRLREQSFLAMARPATFLHLLAWAGGVAVAAWSGEVVPALYLGFLLWFAAGLLHYWHLAWTAPDEPADLDS
jgi:fatty acid desaturase